MGEYTSQMPIVKDYATTMHTIAPSTCTILIEWCATVRMAGLGRDVIASITRTNSEHTNNSQ